MKENDKALPEGHVFSTEDIAKMNKVVNQIEELRKELPDHTDMMFGVGPFHATGSTMAYQLYMIANGLDVLERTVMKNGNIMEIIGVKMVCMQVKQLLGRIGLDEAALMMVEVYANDPNLSQELKDRVVQIRREQGQRKEKEAKKPQSKKIGFEA